MLQINIWIQLLTPIIAIIGIFIAIIQLSKNNKTRNADFIYRLDDDFFTEKTSICIILIEFEAIKFIEQKGKYEDSYFKIDKKIIDNLPDRYFFVKEFVQKRNYEISDFELGDYLLGLIEKIGIYKKKNIMDIEFTYDVFDYYIQKAYNDKAIINYIKWLHKTEGTHEIYSKFDFIAKTCGKYDPKQNKIFNFLKLLISRNSQCGFCQEKINPPTE